MEHHRLRDGSSDAASGTSSSTPWCPLPGQRARPSTPGSTLDRPRQRHRPDTPTSPPTGTRHRPPGSPPPARRDRSRPAPGPRRPPPSCRRRATCAWTPALSVAETLLGVGIALPSTPPRPSCSARPSPSSATSALAAPRPPDPVGLRRRPPPPPRPHQRPRRRVPRPRRPARRRERRPAHGRDRAGRRRRAARPADPGLRRGAPPPPSPRERLATLVVGGGTVGTKFSRTLLENPQYGLLPVGTLDDRAPFLDAPPTPWLAPVDDVARLVRRHDVSVVVIAYGLREDEHLVNLLRDPGLEDTEIYWLPRLWELHTARAAGTSCTPCRWSASAAPTTTAPAAAPSASSTSRCPRSPSPCCPRHAHLRPAGAVGDARRRDLPPGPRRGRRAAGDGHEVPQPVGGPDGVGHDVETSPVTCASGRSGSSCAAPPSTNSPARQRPARGR